MKKKKKKVIKRLIIGIVVIIIVVIISFGIKALVNTKITFDLYNDGDIEVNSQVMVYDLIKDLKNAKIISENSQIDTSKLGRQQLNISFIRNSKKVNKIIDINIVDTTAPSIIANENVVTEVNVSIDLLKDVIASDNSLEEVEVLVVGEYNFNKAGTYALEYVCKDKSGNESRKNFNLIVNNSYKVNGKLVDGVYKTSKGYDLVIKDGVSYIENLIIVNKSFSLPKDYTISNPSNTVSKVSCTNCLDKETMQAFNLMNADAKSIGLNIWIQSGYRSYSLQTSLYNNYVARDGKKAADTYSARPGHSEHQTGYAFDLNTIDDSFQYTDEGKWINDNCHLYGFIIRYPKGKEKETGYMYESWHLRYVGKDLASKLYNNGDWITMEEYFGITSEYSE